MCLRLSGRSAKAIALLTCLCIGHIGTARFAKGFEAEDVSPMGIGLGGVASYTTAWQFVDMFKYAREWRAPKGYEVREDEFGWPVGIVTGGKLEAITPEKPLLMWMYSRYITGKIALTWDGDGEVAVSRENTPLVEDNYPERNRRVYDFKDRNLAVYDVIVRASSPDNHVKNIRMWMPGYENSDETFHSLYKERLAPFPYFRYMDWGSTNNSTQVEWADRKDPRYCRQTGPVAWEHMIALANETHRDMWICIPHMASDDYVRKLAQLIEETLEPGRRVYVEYSNEIWNPAFRQTHWLWERAKEEGHTERPWEYGPVLAGRRSAEIWATMGEEFQKHELVRVFTHFRWIDEGLEACKANGDGKVDLIGLNGYFISQAPLQYTLRNLDDFDIDAAFDYFEQSTLMDAAEGWATEMQRLKAKWGLPITCYEGGQHFANPFSSGLQGEKLVEKMFQVNAHPRIKDVYLAALESWRIGGGDGFTAFVDCGNWGKYGCWGHLRYQDQPLADKVDPQTGVVIEPGAHKYIALVDYIERRKGQQPDRAPHVTTVDLPQPVKGRSYSATLRADGGRAPYEWRLLAGRLPDGLSLAADGTITGTPTRAQQLVFMVEARDAEDHYGAAIVGLFMEPTVDLQPAAVEGRGAAGMPGGWDFIGEGQAKVIEDSDLRSPSGTALLEVNGLPYFAPSARATSGYTVEVVMGQAGAPNQHYWPGVAVNLSPGGDEQDFLRIGLGDKGRQVGAYSRYVAGGQGELWSRRMHRIIPDADEGPEDAPFDPGEFWTLRVTVRPSSKGAIDLLISVFDEKGRSRIDATGHNDTANGMWVMRQLALKDALLSGPFGLMGQGVLFDRVTWKALAE